MFDKNHCRFAQQTAFYYQITLTGTLNMETDTSYTITVRATDQGTTPSALSADTTVVVTVTDANDLAPVCSPAVYNKVVAENAAISTCCCSVIVYLLGNYIYTDVLGQTN